MIFSNTEIKQFIIREELKKQPIQQYQDTLVISQKNILFEHQYYKRSHSEYYKYIYVKSRYGIIKGYRARQNRKGKMNLAYKIAKIFSSEEEAFIDHINIKQEASDSLQWIVFRNTNNKLMMCKSYDKEELEAIEPIETVEPKSESYDILNFETDYTNNLGVKFRIQCRDLEAWTKWIKYKGKIYKAMHYHASDFRIEHNGEFIGINHAVKSKHIDHWSSNGYILSDQEKMEMHLGWIIDEGLGGLSVKGYRRLRNKLYSTFHKHQRPHQSPHKKLDDRDFKADPTVHLYLDEALRDITAEEKAIISKIAYQNKRTRIEENKCLEI